MFHKLLAAIDRSELSQRVFTEALALAKATGASLMLLTVLSPDDEESPSTPIPNDAECYTGGLSDGLVTVYENLWQDYAERRLAMLRSLVSRAATDGVAISLHLCLGQPGPAICQFARESSADLILLGRSGRTGLDELILGSVSNYVTHHAPCSVLTVQHHSRISDRTTTGDTFAKQTAIL